MLLPDTCGPARTSVPDTWCRQRVANPGRVCHGRGAGTSLHRGACRDRPLPATGVQWPLSCPNNRRMSDVMPMEQPSPHVVSPAVTARADPPDPGWDALMVRSQQGDASAYHRLLHEVMPYLRTIVARHPGTREDHEDALQDILLTMHRIRHTYEPGRPFRPWLATIAQRRVIDVLRRRGYRGGHETTLADEELMETLAVSEDAYGPDAVAAGHDYSRQMHDAVQKLPPRQREAFELLRLRELTPDEAAAASVSGQSKGALKVACHRALKSLRAMLKPEV